jgi:hypothetical protein
VVANVAVVNNVWYCLSYCCCSVVAVSNMQESGGSDSFTLAPGSATTGESANNNAMSLVTSRMHISFFTFATCVFDNKQLVQVCAASQACGVD